MRRHITDIFTLVLVLLLSSCSRTPSYVIDPDDMAEIMADMQVAESVVDLNHINYMTDSAKIALRQAVLEKHGVNAERFDTSLVWYGCNIDKFIDVYDNVIKILEKRDRALGNSIVQSAISMSGDSVDVWSGSRYARMSDRMPADMVSFELFSDDNWEPGDVYSWRIKLIDDGVKTVKWNMLACYTDSTSEWLNTTTSNSGWNEVIFAADSTKTLDRIRGVFEIVRPSLGDYDGKVKNNREYWVDSISLIRKRTNPEFYKQRSRLRSYRQY